VLAALALLLPLAGAPAEAGATLAQFGPARPGDRCRASHFQRLVGRPLAEAERLLGHRRPNLVRFVCEGCPTTRDYRPRRITVTFSRPAQTVTSVACAN
jgi:hypothetical protein